MSTTDDDAGRHLWARPSGSVVARTPAWAEVRRRHADIPATSLLVAAVGVVVDRLATPVNILVGGDGAPSGRVRERLESSGPEATWDEVLAEATSGESGRWFDPPGTAVPTLAIEDRPNLAADADLCVAPADDGVRVWRPELSRLSLPWCRSMLDHLEVLFELVAADGDGLGRAEILTAEDLALNGGTPQRLPDYPGITLHELFRLQAWRTPDAVALVGPCGQLTYRELDDMSSLLAGDLVADGVHPGEVVGLCAERSLELFVGLLAVLKSGGVFVFLDPELPSSTLSQQLKVATPARVLAGRGSANLPAVATARALPDVDDLARRPPVNAPVVRVGSGDPAYILFTSGSTGVPKAVLRSHLLHTSRVFLEQSMYGLGAQDRHLLKLSVSARELFWPLATGGACVIVPPGEERDDARLVDLMRDYDVSVLSVVPSVLRVLAAREEFAHLPRLRHVFVGAETLHVDLENQVRRLGYEVHNTFTSSEADYVTHRTGPAPAANDEVSNIGVPLDMRAYVCDDHGRRVPVGVVGEVWAGGPGLADGYLGNPLGTAARFVTSPFGDPQVPVVFRSGDLARIRPDGSYEYCGRRDLQVKVRGKRIEPTEVEYWIRAYPGVDEAAVVGYPDRDQGAVLVAFVATPDSQVTDGDLREHLASNVPAWMVPRHIVFMARLPQMPNGKIDRVALRPPDGARPAAMPAPTAPTDELQATILAIWRRVLQIDDLGVDDAFVDVGGDSLRLMMLRSALQEELSVSVDPVRLMAAPTVRAQAVAFGGAQEQHAASSRADRTAAIDGAQRDRARRAALRRRSGVEGSAGG